MLAVFPLPLLLHCSSNRIPISTLLLLFCSDKFPLPVTLRWSMSWCPISAAAALYVCSTEFPFPLLLLLHNDTYFSAGISFHGLICTKYTGINLFFCTLTYVWCIFFCLLSSSRVKSSRCVVIYTASIMTCSTSLSSTGYLQRQTPMYPLTLTHWAVAWQSPLPGICGLTLDHFMPQSVWRTIDHFMAWSVWENRYQFMAWSSLFER